LLLAYVLIASTLFVFSNLYLIMDTVTLGAWAGGAPSRAWMRWDFRPLTPFGMSLSKRGSFGFAAIWPSTAALQWLLMPFTFLLLPFSLVRAKVRPAHLIRAAAYSVGGMLVFMSLRGVLAWLERELMGWGTFFPGFAFRKNPWLVCAAALAFGSVWWSVVAGQYLKLLRSWLVGLLLSILSSLVSVLVFGLIDGGATYARDLI
jgi:hypothetical protein